MIILLIAVIGASTAMAQQPSFQAPPGYTTQVGETHRTYNFYKLTRTVLLPWDQMQMPESSIPTGNAPIYALRSPSKKATKFYDNTKNALSSFGTPKRKTYQCYQGKDGNGAVMFFEFDNVLPIDAVQQLSKYFFNTSTPPNPTGSTKVEQFLVNDHQVIIWTFQNPKSKVKEEHQKYIFELVSKSASK